MSLSLVPSRLALPIARARQRLGDTGTCSGDLNSLSLPTLCHILWRTPQPTSSTLVVPHGAHRC